MFLSCWLFNARHCTNTTGKSKRQPRNTAVFILLMILQSNDSGERGALHMFDKRVNSAVRCLD